MKRIAFLFAGMMLVSLLTGCSGEPDTLEAVYGSDLKIANQIELIEQQVRDESQGSFKDVHIGFKGNTIVYVFTFASQVSSDALDDDAFREYVKGDEAFEEYLHRISEAMGIGEERISVRVVFCNPDGSELTDVTI